MTELSERVFCEDRIVALFTFSEVHAKNDGAGERVEQAGEGTGEVRLIGFVEEVEYVRTVYSIF